jgi:hypothetical protein
VIVERNQGTDAPYLILPCALIALFIAGVIAVTAWLYSLDRLDCRFAIRVVDYTI